MNENDVLRQLAKKVGRVNSKYMDRDRYVPPQVCLGSDVVLVGEAPGADEVEEQQPFVGRSGELLDECLADVGLNRDSLYVTNTVKVRPPDNADPSPEMIEAWRDVLEFEITAVNPAVIVPLGTVAAQELLDTDERITGMNGSVREVDISGTVRTVVPVLHPAYPLRQRSKIPDLKEGLRTILDVMAEDG